MQKIVLQLIACQRVRALSNYACVCISCCLRRLRFDAAHTSHLQLGNAGGVSDRVFIERSDELRKLDRYNSMGITIFIIVIININIMNNYNIINIPMFPS